jgi:hypothetical protein
VATATFVPVDAWTEVGTVSAAIAAAAGLGAMAVSWHYGRKALAESDRALRYERLREARDLVGRIGIAADNTLWNQANEAGAQLRAVLTTLVGDFAACLKLAETEWDLSAYREQNLQPTVIAARAELEQAVTENA